MMIKKKKKKKETPWQGGRKLTKLCVLKSWSTLVQ